MYYIHLNGEGIPEIYSQRDKTKILLGEYMIREVALKTVRRLKEQFQRITK